MRKSVSIMGTPDSCCDCRFCRELDEGIEACCELMEDEDDSTCCRMIETEFGYCQEKPIWCPLKELPDEIHSKEYLDEYCDGYDDGWNSLRKKILGE